MNRTFLLTILLCHLFFISKATSNDSIFNLSKQFHTHHQNNYQEFIYLHTDKTNYLTGEKIKFKAYCLERNLSKPSQLSKVAYIEILDVNNKAHLQAKIKLDQGTGYGELFIPTNLISSNYIIRGYTRWMRNFGPESYFHSMISIINPFKKLGLPTVPAKENVTVNFFCEGKQLISGRSTKIVYEIKDENGIPVYAEGKVYANDSILIKEFKPGLHGLSSFVLIPNVNYTYHVQLIQKDSTITLHDFLPVSNTGFVVHVEEKQENFEIDIFFNDTGTLNISESLFLVTHQKGRLIRSDQFKLTEYQHEYKIEKNSLEDGVFSISLFTEDGRLIEERKLFMYSDEKAISYSVADKKIYTKRDSIKMDLSIIDDLDLAVTGSLSISVSAINDKLRCGYLNFKEYLLLDNSLNRAIPLVLSAFDGPNVSETINNLLIVYSNSDSSIWSDSQKKNYVAELRNPVITGSIRNKYTGEPGNSIMTYLAIPGKRLQFYPTRSKFDGSLLFELKDFYGSNEVIVQNDYTKDTVYTIELDDPFSKDYLDIDIPELEIDERMSDWILQQSQNMQVENAYSRYQSDVPVLPKVDSAAFFHNPDARYFLDDYTRFVVMEEVMREYVTGVNVRKNRNGFHFMVIDTDRNIIYEDNPLMLLDAVPVFDADEIIAMDPLKIEKIETVKGRFHYGHLDCKGIVSYTTYEGDLDGYSLNDQALVYEYDGLQYKQQYRFPKHKTSFDKRSKIPDYRNNLYWEPELKLSDFQNSNLKIYSSDYRSHYEIRIEGIDAEGNVFCAKQTILIE